MLRKMLKSKIHGVHVSDVNPNYEGSITIGRNWLQAADIIPYEQVHVFDVTNGARFVTYAIEGEPGDLCINGAAARLVNFDDELIILAYTDMNVGVEYTMDKYVPNIVKCNVQ